MTRSPEAAQYHKLYRTARRQRLRASQLAAHPLCAMCVPRVTVATVADHITAHRGNEALFFDPTNVQSLCADHHNIDKAKAERGRPVQEVDGQGWPV